MEATAMPSTAASMYLLCLSSLFPSSTSRIKIGSRFRARTATPFQDRSPFQTAWYPRLPDRIDGEVAVRAFQLLATDYVRRGGGKPLQQVRKAAIYVFDVEGSDPHGGPAHI
jgi:hypothetical protein